MDLPEVEAAIEEVYKTLLIAFILVVLIIYLFLGNLKAVIVPAIALPVSLIASFLGLYIFGLSINIFVLLSFILAIGIITDDSVIMTDAIYRRIENGRKTATKINVVAIIAKEICLEPL